MRYFSLFSGIGGFELGILKAYVEMFNRNSHRRVKKNTKHQSKKGQRLESTQREGTSITKRQTDELLDRLNDKGAPHCVGYSEIDKYATAIYQKHFPEHKNYGDITKIDEKKLPDFDLLVGGFPCQSFSIAGKRKGFEDTRGTLFFEIARILRKKQPRFLCLENVKGLLSHDNGRTFAVIISTLDELGYDIQWQVLNSKNFGVPQNRERVFIVGHLRGTARPEVFPFPYDAGLPIETAQSKKTQSQAEISTTVRVGMGQKSDDTYVEVGQAVVFIPEATRGGYAMAREGDSINLSNMNSKTRRGRVGKGVAQTIDTGMQQHTLTKGDIRRLTPIECERLQGFPDDWTALGSEIDDGVVNTFTMSDTQRYKTLGNAVTVNVVAAVIERLI